MDIYKEKNPLVSVIMVTYNRADYLKRSIQSYVEQNFKLTELIVVDDGSQDNTFSIVMDFMKKHDNIRYMRHTNRNISLSKNAGIIASSGQYITFLDSDDMYKPDHISIRYEFMQQHPEIDMLEGGVTIIGNPYVRDIENFNQNIHLSKCHIGATFFGKREVFIKLNGYNKKVEYSEDSVFWKKANQFFKLKKIDHPSYVYYRDTPGSVCNTIH